MNTTLPAGLTLVELDRRVRAVEPAALLVRPRLLRRVIKRDRNLSGLGLNVPHGSCYLIAKSRLLDSATLDELGVARSDDLADMVLLLARPDGSDLRPGRVRVTLEHLSRQLLHGGIHRQFRQRRAAGSLRPETIRERLAALGDTAREEIRAVLEQESLLLPPETPDDDDGNLYEEFAAVFLELAYHAPHQLPRWFPALDHFDEIRSALIEDLGGEDFGARYLLPGAPAPDAPEILPPESEVLARPLAEGLPKARLLVEAKAGGLRGNLVRAAILRARAGEGEQARATLALLAERLGRALTLTPEAVTAWQEQLNVLIEPAAAGAWSRSARLLYDIQTVCQAREKPFFAVDLIEWAIRYGGPVRRELPHHGEVLSCKHLRRARDRVAGLPISERHRIELDHLLGQAIHRAEDSVRTAFRPRLEKALDHAGFRPSNHVETLARGKVISELLEIVVSRGSLNLGVLRDVIARNRLKLADLSGPGEFLVGDPLLKANAELAVQLDGVYHRGEFYLRWLQSVSSLAFGTMLGRILMLWAILPLLGAFLILAFAGELSGIVAGFTGRHAAHAEHGGKEAHSPKEALKYVTRESMIGIGLFLLAVIHSAAVRQLLWLLLWRVGQGCHFLFVALPRAVLRFPPIQWFLQSRLYVFCYLVLFRPFLVALLVVGIAWLCDATHELLMILGGATFLVAAILLNSPVGRHLEEWLGDGLVRTWTLIREDLLVGLVQGILALFRRIVEEVDKLFYTVDEWLRSRAGESRFGFLLKVVLSTLWWCITFVFRFAFVVLIEPQINPIKHFPVVTVGHKVLLLAVEPTARAVAASSSLDFYTASGIVVAVFSLIPGIFGFLAWELQANWLLYKANQSPTLDPMSIGSHGETMRGLLRPGFHSGTVPKLFARLRSLPERAETSRLRRAHDALHHSEEAIAAFVQRDLIDALQGTHVWSKYMTLRVAKVRLDTRRVRISLRAAEREGNLELAFEQCGPYLVFRVEDVGWLAKLPDMLVALWRDALIGFCKHAGVHLTPTQLAAALPGDARWRIADSELLVESGHLDAARYDLEETPDLTPSDSKGYAFTRWPTLPRERVRFDAHPVAWADWVEVWQLAKKGKKPPELLPGVPVPGCP